MKILKTVWKSKDVAFIVLGKCSSREDNYYVQEFGTRATTVMSRRMIKKHCHQVSASPELYCGER